MGGMLETLTPRETQYLMTMADFQFSTGKMLPSYFQISERYAKYVTAKLKRAGAINKITKHGIPLHPESRIPIRRSIFFLTNEGRAALGARFLSPLNLTNQAASIATFEYVASQSHQLLHRIRGKITAANDFMSRDGRYILQPDATYILNGVLHLVFCDDELLGIEAFVKRIYPIVETEAVRERCMNGVITLLCFSDDRKRELQQRVSREPNLEKILHQINVITYDDIIRSI